MNEKYLDKVENLLEVFSDREHIASMEILDTVNKKKVSIVLRNDGALLIEEEVFKNNKEAAMKIVDLLSVLGSREIQGLEYTVSEYGTPFKYTYEDVVL